MKKLSLVLAFVGLISAASFAGNSHPQDAKKQSTEKTATKAHKHAKKDTAKKADSKPKAGTESKTK